MATTSKRNKPSGAAAVERARQVTDMAQMDPALALELFRHGAFLIFTDFPEGSEFGIDYKSWTVGPKFLGLKMIPPGVHFIYYNLRMTDGQQAPRIGFFYEFKAGEVLVKKWNKQIEDMDDEQTTEEEVERYRANLKELDDRLGPYPYDTYRDWFSLSNHLSGELANRLSPRLAGGRITMQCELVSLETETLGSGAATVDRTTPNRLRFSDEQGLPIMRVKPGHEIRFNAIPTDKVSARASMAERSRYALDDSDRLSRFLTDAYESWTAGGGEEAACLGELQFAFVCFLMGHVYESFDQWKRLVHLLCFCREALTCRPKLYSDFIMSLHFQLRLCPRDFFVDIVTRNNFLTVTLARLFANVRELDDVESALKERAANFQKYLTKTFQWKFELDD